MCSFEKEELELAKKLKKCCDGRGKETDISKSTPILQQLGVLYGKRCDKFSLVRAVGLLYAALVRQPENESIEKDIDQLCKNVLRRANAEQVTANLGAIALKFKKQLEPWRLQVKMFLKNHENIPEKIGEEALMALEKKKIKDVQAIQEMVTNTYVEIMNGISRKCMAVMGQAPCKFTLVGMGSVARGEVSPYSDFESIIVLEDGVQDRKDYKKTLEYFRWLAVIYQFILVGLQETILRFLAIPCLNNESVPGGDWFFDAHTPCGICPDGLAPHACKNPLGRQEPTETKSWITELIKPVSEMATYLDREEDLKNGYYLGDLLTRSRFVSGDRDVYEQFVREVKKKLVENENYHKLVTTQLVRGLQEFDTETCLARLFAGRTCDIKRVVYRATTIFLSAVGRLQSIDENSCFGIIQELERRNLIDHYTAHNVAYAVAVACQVRLSVYMSGDGQNDILSESNYYDYNDNLITQRLIEIVGKRSTIDYFVTAVNLQGAVYRQEILQQIEVGFFKVFDLPSSKFIVLHFLKLHDDLIEEWKTYSRIYGPNNFPEEDDLEVRYFVAVTHHLLGNLDEAKDMFTYLNDYLENNGIKEAILLGNILVESGRFYMMTRYPHFAIDYLNKAKSKIENLETSVEKKNDFLANVCHFLGQCNCQVSNFEIALACFRETLNYVTHTSKLDNKRLQRENMTVLKLLCQLEIVRCLVNLERNMEGLSLAMETLNFGKARNVPHTLLANCYNAVGVSHLSVSNHAEALKYFEEEHKIRCEGVPDDVVDENLQLVEEYMADCRMALLRF
ncbi:unnamed protein product [Clavelina lepadiformis]|uniref:Protein-PII uridylyltransferase N-terminal domain-containing protein n=1 Tax=Clavelina lepadiformis TaxID=159417 RepID=A0ABP0GVC5_CLALP